MLPPDRYHTKFRTAKQHEGVTKTLTTNYYPDKPITIEAPQTK